MKRFKSKVLFVCVLTLLLGIAQVSIGAPPTNDNRQNAKSIGNVTNQAFDTTQATFDGPEICMSGKNIWYCYTAPCTGAATVSLCGSNFDTKLATYNGCSSTPTLGNMIRCNDDFCGRQSEVVFPVIAGNKYLIEVGGYNILEYGPGVLNITCDGAASPPANDNWSSAQSVGNISELAFDTTFATFDGSGNCITSPNIWYCYTAPHTTNVTVSLCGSEFDTMLAIYNGCNTFPILANLIDCNDDSCGRQSQITFAAIAGNRYLIEVGGFDTESRTGPGVISISSGFPPPGGLLNDDCINAIPIGNVTNLAFNTEDAQFDGAGHCMSSPNIWYCYNAPRTGEVTVSLCGSEFDTKLAVYNGCGCNPLPGNLIGCNDDFCSRQSELTFDAIAGNKYLIEIGGFTDSNWGPGILNISSEGGPFPPPSGSNDDCQKAKLIGNVTGLTFDTSNATFDGPGHCLTSPNIWYIYNATCTGEAIVSLCGSSYDTKLAVYNGGGCNPSQSRLIECNDDFCGWQSEITLDVTAGQQYLIEVGGFGDNAGEGLISVSCDGATTTARSDLGDAPDSTNNFGRNMTAYPKGGPSGVKAHYPTVYNDGRTTGPFGPIHLNAQAVVAHLGKQITSENEADTGPDQDITNNIKPTSNMPDNDKGDDGIIFPVNMPKCSWTTLDYIVNVVNPGTNLWVNIWCDWNRDGDWDDNSNTTWNLACSGGIVSEWAVQNQYLINLPAGLNQITTPAFLSWHPNAGRKQIWMRITLSPKPWTSGSAPGVRGNGGSGPRAGHEFGETEDYYFFPDSSFTICQDYNGDGIINLQDLAAFTTDWLENCP
ncbi:MAG: hypothetical protein FVQ84_16895 [Planctomycetes bacterium]|nr:hypothetical protein [Planctomycetota bacterium]